MKFFPAWMNYGICISLAALAGLVVLMIVRSVRRRNAPAEPVPEEAGAEEETAEAVITDPADGAETGGGAE